MAVLLRRRFRGGWGVRFGHRTVAAAGGVHSAQVPDSRHPRQRTDQTVGVPEEHRRRRQQRHSGRRPLRRRLDQIEQRAVAQDQVRIVRGRSAAATATAVGRHQHTRFAQRTAQKDTGFGENHERHQKIR